MRGVLFGVALLAAGAAGAQEVVRVDRLDAVGEVFDQLLEAESPWDAVVIALPRGDAFLQFAKESGGLTLDFPAVTEVQEALVPRVKAELVEAGVDWEMIPLDGGETLLAPVGAGARAKAVALELAGALYGVRAGAEVQFVMIDF